jgi:branched-chain amino acid transport system permease protein
MVISGSLNIVLGFVGLANLGESAFIGIGAYVFAVLVCQGLNPYISIIIGGLVSFAASLLLGLIVLRLKGPFFPIGTMMLANALPFFITGTGVAGGTYGLSLYKAVGESFNIYLLVYILHASSAAITIISYMLKKSKFGYSLVAIREDEDAAQTIGVNVFKSKLIAYAVSSFFPGIAGGILAFRAFWVHPGTAFAPIWTLEAMNITLIGGSGSVFGPIIGAIMYQVLKNFVMNYAPGVQLIIFGVLLIIVILFAPEGLVGTLRNRFKKLQRLII